MPLTITITTESLQDTSHAGRVRMVSGTYTITGGSVFICDASAGAFTITLPAAGAYGDAVGIDDSRFLIIKKKDSSVNAVTISRAGSDTIDGATTHVLSAQYDTVMLVDDDDADSWNIVSTI